MHTEDTFSTFAISPNSVDNDISHNNKYSYFVLVVHQLRHESNYDHTP